MPISLCLGKERVKKPCTQYCVKGPPLHVQWSDFGVKIHVCLGSSVGKSVT